MIQHTIQLNHRIWLQVMSTEHQQRKHERHHSVTDPLVTAEHTVVFLEEGFFTQLHFQSSHTHTFQFHNNLSE